MAKGSGSNLWRNGHWVDWKGYRYGPGDRPQPSLPAIFTKSQRETFVLRTAALLDEAVLSPFEYEGLCRAGIRSALCLRGHAWRASDRQSEIIVEEALRRNGAERPTWEHGQREYTISPDYCAWCHGPMDVEEISKNKRFCCVDCARASIAHHRTYVYGNRKRGKVLHLAYSLLAKDRSRVRDCLYCGKQFKSAHPDTKCCSARCGVRLAYGERLRDPRPCEACGTLFVPSNKGSTCCSRVCGNAIARQRKRELLAQETRTCGFCCEPFTPTSDRSKFCSPRCNHNAANKAYREKQGFAEHHLTCEWCSAPFVSKMPWAKCCSEEHAEALYQFRQPSKRPKRITPGVFDYVFRLAA